MTITRTFAGVTLNGLTLRSQTRKGLTAMARRRNTVIVDSWPADDPPPFGSSDARDWEDYRTRHGYAPGW